MTGVEILAIEEVAATFGFDWSGFWLFVGFGSVIITLIIGMALYSDIGMYGVLIGLLGGLCVTMSIGACCARDATPLEYETHYKVTISEEVKMTEFLERYEIIDQEGKIYTVRERGNDND